MLWENSVFCTNFYELAGGGIVENIDGGVAISSEEYLYSLKDLLAYEMEEFFVVSDLRNIR